MVCLAKRDFVLPPDSDKGLTRKLIKSRYFRSLGREPIMGPDIFESRLWFNELHKESFFWWIQEMGWDGVKFCGKGWGKKLNKIYKTFWPHYVGKRKGVQATQGDSSNFECV